MQLYWQKVLWLLELVPSQQRAEVNQQQIFAFLCHLCQCSLLSTSPFRCCPRCSFALQELSPVQAVVCGQEGFEHTLIFFRQNQTVLDLTFLQDGPKVALPTPSTTVQHPFRRAASTPWPCAGLKWGSGCSALLCSATGCRLWSGRLNPDLQQCCSWNLSPAHTDVHNPGAHILGPNALKIVSWLMLPCSVVKPQGCGISGVFFWGLSTQKAVPGHRVSARDRGTDPRVSNPCCLREAPTPLAMHSQGASPEGCTHTLSFKKLSRAHYFERWQVEVGCVFTQ